MSQQFEWDKRKADANLRKHGVSFGEALTVFADPLARIQDDPDHSSSERREIIIGHSAANRALVVGLPSEGPVSESLMLDEQRRKSAKNMKKVAKNGKMADDLRSEYDFSSGKTRPNRFASRMKGRVVAVVLEPDVAAVFDSSEAVNKLLRSVIAALPEPGRAKRAKVPRRKTD